MRFGIFGPVEVFGPDGPVSVGQPRHRALLGYLLVNANRLVTTGEVIEALWAGTEPSSALSQVHIAVSRLRRELRELGLGGVLQSRPGGYFLVLADGDLDAAEFDREVNAARDAQGRGDWTGAARLLRSALARWRGEALGEVTAPYAGAARHRLHESRLAAQILLAEAELATGRHDAVIGELEDLVRQHPDHERLVSQLMLAQYRSGRRTEALATARRLRGRLAAEQGLDPGPSFVELERAILNADPSLDSPAQPQPPSSPRPRSGRNAVVTVPAQLPLDVYGFAGRERELNQLDVMTDVTGHPPLMLISGTAGVGKTALALRWAHRRRECFPDGQLFANLRGFDVRHPPSPPLAVLRHFLRSLEPGSAPPEDLDEAAALFRSHLTDRRMLIVLDNVADAEQVRPLLPGSAGCTVVLTSRHRLPALIAHQGVRLLRLGPLRPDDAAQLLRDMLASSASGATLGQITVVTQPARAEWDAAIAQLADRCARLPLALRLAAAQLVCRDQLTVAEYVDQLAAGDVLTLLDHGVGTQDAVSSAFAVSYRSLTPAAQRLFRLLGLVQAHDFTAPVAAALLGDHLGEAGAREPLAELVAANLVGEYLPHRYQLHDLLRGFAEKICVREETAAERQAATRRLTQFFRDTADRIYLDRNHPLRCTAEPSLRHMTAEQHRDELVWGRRPCRRRTGLARPDAVSPHPRTALP